MLQKLKLEKEKTDQELLKEKDEILKAKKRLKIEGNNKRNCRIERDHEHIMVQIKINEIKKENPTVEFKEISSTITK
ncbi:hypothetical protein M5689_017994 [Euphorbia peplus]|nr:hypothetical protein M5689_017994 [Euphorbia peplus]